MQTTFFHYKKVWRLIMAILIFTLSIPLPGWGRPAVPPIRTSSEVETPKSDPTSSNLFLFRDKNNYWVTLNSTAHINGPILPHEQGEYNHEEYWRVSRDYVRSIFGLTIQAANKYAQKVLESPAFENPADRRDINGYWAFLMASLVVPYHESKLSHIRSDNANKCNDKANQFNLANNSNGKVSFSVLNILNNLWNKLFSPLTARCQDVKDPFINQFLFNGTAVGMWQANVRYHIDAAAPEVVLNLRETIDYGVGYLFQGSGQPTSYGYYGILKRYPKYEHICRFKRSNPRHEKTKDFETNNIYFNLIRGLYGGQYYYGQTLSPAVCSFDPVYVEQYKASHSKGKSQFNFNSDWEKANEDFYRSMKDVLLDSNNIYRKFLPEGSLERNVFDVIISNFIKMHSSPSGGLAEDPTKLESLQELLKINYIEDSEIGQSQTFQENISATHFSTAAKTIVYSEPKESAENICGYLYSPKGDVLPVNVINKFSSNSTFNESSWSHQETPETSHGVQQWASIKIPTYTHILSNTEDQDYIVLTRGRRGANIRSRSGNKFLETGLVMRDDIFSKLIYLDESYGGEGSRWFKVGVPLDSSLEPGMIDALLQEKTSLYRGKTYYTGWVNELNVEVQTDKTSINNPRCNNLEVFYVSSEFLEKIPDKFTAQYKYSGVINTRSAAAEMQHWLRVRPTESFSTTAVGLIQNGTPVYVLETGESSSKIWYPRTTQCYKFLKDGKIPEDLWLSSGKLSCTGWVGNNVIKKEGGEFGLPQIY